MQRRRLTGVPDVVDRRRTAHRCPAIPSPLHTWHFSCSAEMNRRLAWSRLPLPNLTQGALARVDSTVAPVRHERAAVLRGLSDLAAHAAHHKCNISARSTTHPWRTQRGLDLVGARPGCIRLLCHARPLAGACGVGNGRMRGDLRVCPPSAQQLPIPSTASRWPYRRGGPPTHQSARAAVMPRCSAPAC